MSVASRDELVARLSFLSALFPEKRVLCVGIEAVHVEDVKNVLSSELGASLVTVSHLREAAASKRSHKIWTDLTDVENGAVDIALCFGAELLCDEPWYQELRRCLAQEGRIVVIADNPDVHGDGPSYDDIVASLSPHFAAIELVTETRMAAQVLTPYGAEPESMALDASMLTPQDARTWIFVCGEEGAGFSAETITLLDEASSVEAFTAEHEERERLEHERDSVAKMLSALQESVERANTAFASERDSRALATEALANAESRVEDLQQRLRQQESEREASNDLQREMDSVIAKEEETRRLAQEVEAARRGEHDGRMRAERFATELEGRHATMKGELAQRETRIKRLVEEVQRLEGELQGTREDSETRIGTLTRERDDRRDLASRLGRDGEALRTETLRLQALLTRARDDLQLMQEQQAQGRAVALQQREALERETSRARDANEALIAASSTLNQRERTIEEQKVQLRLHDGTQTQLRHDNDELQARLTHAQETSAAHRSARERSEAALKGASSELLRLQGQLTLTAEQLEVAEKRLLSADSRLRDAEARAHETAAEYRLLLTSADTELANAKTSLAQKEHALAERSVALEQADADRRNVCSERDALQLAEQELSSALDQAKAETRLLTTGREALIAAEGTHKARIEQLEELVDKLANGNTRLEAQLARAENDLALMIQEAKETRMAADQKVKALESLLATAEGSAKEAQRKHEEESRRSAITSGNVNELERKRVAAVSEAELHRQRAESLSASAAEAERERDRLASELTMIGVRQDGMKKEVEQERGRANELMHLLDAERAQLTEVRRELASAKAAVAAKGDSKRAVAAGNEKSQEWQVLDTFADPDDVMMDAEWSKDDEKTRVVK